MDPNEPSSPRHFADTILFGGHILTIDSRFSAVEALAVGAGRILATGSSKDVLRLAGPRTRCIDLGGRTAVPGFVDAHAHMDREGLRHAYPNLQECRSIDDVQDVTRRWVSSRNPGEWVVLLPMGQPPFHIDPHLTLAEERYPDRHDLDQAAPENPVWVRAVWPRWNSRSPYVHILNSAALRACGLTESSVSPTSAVEIERDASGALTGRILEYDFVAVAEHTILRNAPPFDHSVRVEALRKAMSLSVAGGTTSVYEGHGVAAEVLRAYRELHERGELTVRAYLPISPPPWSSMAQAERELIELAHDASGTGLGDAWLTVGGVHLSYGGQAELASLSQSAWPSTGWAGFGEQYLPPDEYRALCRLAARLRLRVNTTVDREIDEVLSVWEDVNREFPVTDLRWVLVHGFRIDPKRDFPRIKRLGCVMTALPPSAVYRSGLAMLKEEPTEDRILACHDYTAADLPWAMATDNKPHELLFQLWAAVNRRERLENRVIAPDQRLTVPQALRAMTTAGAVVTFAEHEKGSLEPGKVADLLVLSEDPMRIEPEALRELRVELAMVDGRIMHDTGALGSHD